MLRREQDQYDEAEEILSEVLQSQRKKFGPIHPVTLETLHEPAVLCLKQSRYAEEEEYLLEAINGRIKKLGQQYTTN